MALFDTTFCWFAIVNIAVSGTVFELFDVEWYRDHEIWVIAHSSSFNMVQFENLGAVFYSPSIVTMGLSCISSEIKRDIGRKSCFYTPLAFDAPVRGSPSEYFHPVWYGKTRIVGYPMVEKNFEGMYNRLDTIPAWDGRMDRQTDRQTDILSRHSPRYAYASRGKNHYLGKRNEEKLLIRHIFVGKLYFWSVILLNPIFVRLNTVLLSIIRVSWKWTYVNSPIKQ